MESNKNIFSEAALDKNTSDEDRYKVIGGAAILGISGISAIVAGLVTSHVAKKRNKEFLKEIGKEAVVPLVQTPYSLAFKALAWGTVWSVGGFSVIMYGVWKWFGFKNMEDLRLYVRSNIKKPPPTGERTEFESLRDLVEYISEKSKAEDKKKKT